MNIFQLTCFLAVANTLSFARAAVHLNVTQPAVTHQIKSLESELNVKLFRRSTRIVELTPEGQAFVIDAKNMIDIAEHAKKRFSDPTERKIDSLSIGLSNYAQFNSMSEILHIMSDEFPNLHPRLHIVPHEQLFHLLENESADVVFAIRESGDIHDKLIYRELVTSSFAGICRSDNPIAQETELTLERLKSEKLIFCDPFTSSAEIAKLQIQLALDKDPADIHFGNSAASTFILAAAGLGIAVIPELFIPSAPYISTLKITDAPKISYGMFCKSYSGNEVLKRFIQITDTFFAENVRLSDTP